MTNAHHTPGPWEHGNNGLIYGQCGEDDVEAPFVCDVIEDSAMQALGMLSPGEEANALRICAAVNASKGISTEALERDVIAEMLSALRHAKHVCEQHDEWWIGEFINEINDAIAKATGRTV